MKHGYRKKSERGGIIVNLIVLVAVVIFCGVLYLVRHPILRFMAEEWIVEDALDKSDALIVLGDDNYYADRATRAAELYRQGMAPLVVASGRRLRPNAGISELMEHDLIERGVPKEKILRLSHDADNTKEEAETVAKLAKERRWKSIVVVTSNYHTRRTRYICSRVFPVAISVSVASARDGSFDPERWWEKRESTKLFVQELAGMVVALWELRRAENQGVTAGAVGPEGLLGMKDCGLKRHKERGKSLLALYN